MSFFKTYLLFWKNEKNENFILNNLLIKCFK